VIITVVVGGGRNPSSQRPIYKNFKSKRVKGAIISATMKEYYIALGNWTQVCKEVSTLLNHGYQLAGNLVVLNCKDDEGDFVTYYQPLVGEKISSND
jgi:hypothetical protein